MPKKICIVVANYYPKISNNLIDGSKKIGYYLPGTNIPIYNEKKLYEDQPEYAFIFSWHIYNELIANLKNKGFKGKFIIPLPNPFVLS